MWTAVYDFVMKGLGQFLGYVLVAMGVYLLIVAKSWLCRRYKNSTCLYSTIRVSSAARRHLAHLAGLLHADRCMLIMFHNGDYFSNGSSILKMTCYSEWHAKAMASASERFRDVLISTVEESVQDFLLPAQEARKLNIHTQDPIGYGYWPTLLNTMGAHHWCVLPLFGDKRIVGFMLTTWNQAPNRTHIKGSEDIVLETLGCLEYSVNHPEDCGLDIEEVNRRKQSAWWQALGDLIKRAK